VLGDATPDEQAPLGEAIGPWDALGDGETFEDRLSALLPPQNVLPCTECGAPVPVSQDNLGRWAMELLASW
jgi:hypothetical protein